jgi:hypothetical protein
MDNDGLAHRNERSPDIFHDEIPLGKHIHLVGQEWIRSVFWTIGNNGKLLEMDSEVLLIWISQLLVIVFRYLR